MTLSPGTRLGAYEIQALVGSGGMGEVYRALDTRLNRVVAIKRSKAAFTDRFEREARAVAALNHPNVCHLYDVGVDYLVMEFVDGSRIAPTDSIRKLLNLAVQIADGLAAAHAAGLIHRDLKPDNIVVTRDGRVKILDFGVAKLLAGDDGDLTRQEITGSGVAVGTAGYMSPEQARGDGHLGPQSDQFSFGLVLYELATGRRAFQRPSVAETMAAIIRDEPPPLPETVPAPLRWIVERLLAKDPADRYDSTRDLYRDLKQLRDRLGESSGELPASAPVRGAKPRRLARGVAMLAIALAAGSLLTLLALPAPPPNAAALRFTPLSRQDATEREPEWSPDGKSIAFVVVLDGVGQIFTKSLDSPEPAQLTHSTIPCMSPFWSADGSTIYYLASNALWAVPATGGAVERVMDDVQSATIHPDGKTLLFVRRGRLLGDALGGTRPRDFGAPPFPNQQVLFARFSPDGSRVMVGAGTEGWILSFPSGAAHRIVTLTPETSAAWFPDSRHIVVSRQSATGATTTLSMIDAKDGSEKGFYEAAGGLFVGSVSPDGKRIAYMSGQAEWNVVEVSLSSRVSRPLMSGSGVISWWPDWSPTGTHYLVSTNRSGTVAIEDVSAGDGFSRRLVASEPGTFATSPRWAPDGSRFAFYTYGPGGGTLLAATSAGGRPTLMASLTPAAMSGVASAYESASWSPDGRWLAFVRVEADKWQLVKVPATGAGRVIVVKEFDLAEQPTLPGYPNVEWSPAGDSIICPTRNGLTIVSSDGQNVRPLTAHKLQPYGFSKDGRRVYGIERGPASEGAPWQLYSVDVRTGASALLGTVDLPASTATLAGFSLHPDGTRFITSIAKFPFDIWMLEGFEQPQSWTERAREALLGGGRRGAAK